MLFAEGVECFALGRRTSPERLESSPQQGDLPRDHGAEIHLVSRKIRTQLQLAGIEITALHERVETDQQRIAGESREALIRRVPIASRAQRQNLPDALAGIAQKVGEAMCLGPQFADAVRLREEKWGVTGCRWIVESSCWDVRPIS